jgi:hypothetical protein
MCKQITDKCESAICALAIIIVGVLAVYGLMSYMYTVGLYFGIYPYTLD